MNKNREALRQRKDFASLHDFDLVVIVDLGFGRSAVSAIEAPIILANLVRSG